MSRLADQIRGIDRGRQRPERGQRQPTLADQIRRRDSSDGSVGRSLARVGIGAAQGLEGLLSGLIVKRSPDAPDIPSLSEFLEQVSGETVEPGKEGVAATVGQAIGGIAPSFILGATVGLPTTIGIFAASNFGRALKEADDAGLDDDKKFAFAAANAGLAPLEALPVGRTLSFLNRGTGGLVQKLANRAGTTSIRKLVERTSRNRAGRSLISILQAAPEEAIQESLLNQIPENALARAFGVDPERSLRSGAGRAALLGALGGGIGAGAISPFVQGVTTNAIQEQSTTQSDENVLQPEGPSTSQGQVSTEESSQGIRESGQAQGETQVDDGFRPVRVSETEVVNIKPKGTQEVVSPEGTITTTPRQEDLKSVVSDDVIQTFESEHGTRSFEQAQKLAREQNVVSGARAIADSVNTSRTPKVLNDIQKAGLAERLEQLRIEERDVLVAQDRTQSNEEIEQLRAVLDRVTQDSDAIELALLTSGSETGRALAAQRLLIDESFNISMVERRAQAAKGSPLTAQERAALRRLVQELSVVEDQIKRISDEIEVIQASPRAPKAQIRRLQRQINELDITRYQRRQQIRKGIEELRPLSTADRIGEVFNISRTMLVSLDVSGVLRQGGKLGLANPELIIRNVGPMIRALASERNAIRIHQSILNDPDFTKFVQGQLHISEPFGTKLSAQEEAYMRRTHLDKIPIAGAVARASERAFTAYLNLLRVQAFKKFMRLTRASNPTLEELRGIGNAVNILTGRGDLGRFNQAAVALNTFLFAPRYVASQFQTLTLNPIRRAGSNRVRRVIIGQYVRMLSSFGLLTAMAAAAGFDIEDDPRSSDFLKFRSGKTRVDMGTGLLQPIVLISRTNPFVRQTKSPVTGRVRDLRGRQLFEVFTQFARTKFSPATGMAVDILVGENVIGDDVEVSSVQGIVRLGSDQLIPISLQEIVELLQEDEGLDRVAIFSLLGLLGAGISTFDKIEPKPSRR